jgi:hypothetical protein
MGTMLATPLFPAETPLTLTLELPGGVHPSSRVSIERFRLKPDESPKTIDVPIAPFVNTVASGMEPVEMNCYESLS